MVIGIDLDGTKDVLGIWIGENESAKFWLSVLNELKNRGVQDILIASVDNLTGFSESIAACYPDAQKCIVHQIRNSIRYVSYKDVKKITAALREVRIHIIKHIQVTFNIFPRPELEGRRGWYRGWGTAEFLLRKGI